ncbi:hypothetical protein C4561_01345 [candidate division WWE3 bacterium]|uniref:Uncharacterized protein n=1 Tax=candidate division WWE3 bacterium TaxID=2053526 RepID=A0A3A4ZLH4_UNCKA|nr:MAG: hypothetical protein C4561_01345 [candidate division WWE3 bacterium]
MIKSTYKSRATRLSQATAPIDSMVVHLEEIRNEFSDIEDASENVALTKEQEDELSAKIGEVWSLDIGEIESLSEEMSSWRDNMNGTNLESTSKYETVSECADTLENVVSELSSLDEPRSLDELEAAIATLQSALLDLENIEFPGMYS